MPLSTELILLGAGASVEAGMPTAASAPNEIRKFIENCGNDSVRFEGGSEAIRVLDYITTQLSARHRSLDIEEIFRCIDALYYRNESSLSPFVDRFDPFINTIDGDFDHPKYRTGWLTSPQEFPTYGAFHSLKFHILTVLDALTWPKPDGHKRLDYLRPLIRHAAKRNTWLVTLNYDPFIERTSQQEKLPACLGVETWHNMNNLTWDTKCLNLIKLHGSFDWYTDFNGFKYNEDFASFPPIRPSIFDPMILYGNQAKFYHYGPFPDLFMAFKAALRNASRVSVIGFSFCDDHVTECLYQWLRDDPSKSIRIANGTGFSAKYLPKRIRDGYFTNELSERVEIHSLRASEAISTWYAQHEFDNCTSKHWAG